ncbi:hypothetical protein IFM89_024238 [Coptis chinensis]|uniref:Uncharacterized protein n=1 Tax=Coptis chinensis TaxID=261450 RepID=A0A835GYY1_9MAGN|nr:hypothetical protein IFM89_024238 [Coptis chinensis]
MWLENLQMKLMVGGVVLIVIVILWLMVADFDVVTYTVVMPKDMVKGICNSLEQSQCRSSVNSAGCSTYILSIPKYGHRYWAFDNGRHYDSCSEESDSTDSNYQVFGYYIPASTISCGGASLYSDAESSPRGSTLDTGLTRTLK